RFLMIATLYSPDCAGILGLGGSWLGARGCGSSDRVFSGRSCQVEFSLQSRLRRSCQALSPQPATRVRRGMPASIRTLLAPRRGLDRKSTRLNSSHGSISYAVFCLKKKNKRTAHYKTTKLQKNQDKQNNRRKTKTTQTQQSNSNPTTIHNTRNTVDNTATI